MLVYRKSGLNFIKTMDVRESYDNWADQYDSNVNKTRDLESLALKESLADISFESCLEIGCGTGKNSIWLQDRARHITAVDLSNQMLLKAKEKIMSANVNFVQADINQPWTFTNRKFDLITFSLVLEHIEDLESIFRRAAEKINPGGYIYIGELHPFKQYSGSKARFETERGEQIVTCFTHNISEFTHSAKNCNFFVVDINEYFDDDKTKIPRILTIVFRNQI